MELFTQGVTSDTAAAAYGSILLAWAVWVWVNGLIGIFRAKSIRRTYGSLLDGAWASCVCCAPGLRRPCWR